MKYSVRLLEKIERLCEYLVHTQTPEEEIECYYEFCYKTLIKARQSDESINSDLIAVLLEEDLSKLHLALHGLLYEKVYDQYASRQE